MPKIFINYRRDDSAANAGRLYDRLASHFDPDHLFMDIDQIAPGDDFTEVIQEKLGSVQIAVVLIGKHWLDMTDSSGRRRLDNPDDFVRLEIVTLLERKIRIIPVLVGGADMPESSQLPECLMPLTRRHAYEISNNRFHTDVDKLIQVLEKAMGVQTPSPPPVRPDSPKIPFAAILGVLVTLLAAFGLFHYSPWIAQETGTQRSQPVAPEPEKWVAKQSTVELPSETRLPFEPEMVRIPSGKFRMGSPETEEGRASDEGPQHEVAISRPFALSRHEITVGKFRQFVEDVGYRTTAEQSGKGCYVWNADKKEFEQLPERNWKNPGFKQNDSHPAVCVSWDDVQAYISWLSDRSGKRYRLPTEAEWEYAVRAGTTTARFFPHGQQCQYANGLGQEVKAIAGSHLVLAECTDDYVYTAPVGRFKSNQYGLSDMLGNVNEWTQDCGHDNYNNAPGDGSVWLDKGGGDCSRRVVRGGSWFDVPQVLRSADRNRDVTYSVNSLLGFRVARDF